MIEHFHKPKTAREALRLKKKYKETTVFLAGGTFVNSIDFPLRPGHIIALGGLKLGQISQHAGNVTIGALCTLQQMIEDKEVPRFLKAAASQVVSRNIRNMATIGGHIANNRTQSDLIPMLIALDAKVELLDCDRAETIPLADYIETMKEGLITKIIIPKIHIKRVAACYNFRSSANARSILTAAVSVTLDRVILRDPIIALGGVARHAVRLTSVEEKLNGKPLPETDGLQEIVRQCVESTFHLTPGGGSGFKEYQAGVVVALAAKNACRQKGGV